MVTRKRAVSDRQCANIIDTTVIVIHHSAVGDIQCARVVNPPATAIILRLVTRHGAVCNRQRAGIVDTSAVVGPNHRYHRLLSFPSR